MTEETIKKIQAYTPEFFTGEIEDIIQSDDPGIKRPANVHINANVCLTLASAEKLADILYNLNPTITMAPPIIQAMGSPEHFNQDVPHLRFPAGVAYLSTGAPIDIADGTVVNAADLAMVWSLPGVSGPSAIMDQVLLNIRDRSIARAQEVQDGVV